MSIASTTLNYNYASPDASRTASAAQGLHLDAATAEQVRASLPGQLHELVPGTTVTARYQYKVGADGTLVPIQTQITTEANESGLVNRDGTPKQRSRQALSQQSDARRQSLGDIAKPRAHLSPSEELALFSAASGNAEVERAIAPASRSVSASSPVQGEAVAGDGSIVDVEIFTSNTQLVAANQNNAQVLELNARTQQTAVAALYARNNDIVFSGTPLSQLAA